MLDPKMIALAVFILCYALFILFIKQRMWIALGGALVLVATRVLSLPQAFSAINWNVMGIFVGTLALADVFMESRAPAHFAEIIVDRSKNIAWAILAICGLASFISAFVENVATVLVIAPIALAVAKKLKINPMNMMIAIAISSNLQGTATLIGDPPSMLLGGFAKMNFFDFFFYKGRMSIFFAVELGAIVSFFVLYAFFRQHREKVELIRVEKVRSWWPTILLVSLVILLAASSFFDKGFSYLAGLICMIFGVAALVIKKTVFKESIWRSVRGLDWETTLFLIGIFILVGAITMTGWIDTFSTYLSGIIGTNVFVGYTLIVFLSVALSAFIDNVPFLAAMLPACISVGQKLQMDPTLFLFGLLIGASLGGNITPIGASANIVAVSLLKKEGQEIRFMDFVKLGLPFTLVAVTTAYVFIWLIWH